MLFNENKGKSTDLGPPYYVNVDVTSGESLAIKLFDGNKKFVTGPASITMHSNCPYPPIPLPNVNLPPGHMMQQIVDENGILKHIIISNSVDQMPKNQILTKNGAKLIPLNGTRFNSFKKKLSPSIDTFSNSKTNRFLSTPNDTYNTTNLLNSNNLIYPFCCCCCIDCLNISANNQLNTTNSVSNYYLDNELNYGRTVSNFYPSSTNTATSKPISINYPKRQFLNSTTTSTNRNNRDMKSDNKNDNYNINSNCLNIKTNNINNHHLNSKNNKIINGKNSNILNNKCNNLNYSSKNTLSANYPIKNALLSNKQICKQCVQQQQQQQYSFNQKYLYTSPNSYTSSSFNQTYQQPITNSNSYQYMNNINNKKLTTYASESSKQSLKNRASSSSTNRSNSTVLINSSPGLLNEKNQINNNNNNKKDQNDCYSELIRYVNSNHISAFKSHKRIDATNLTNNKENNNLLINNSKEPSSTTASSSPVSEHYDFSSEESDQTTYKHTTLLNYPPSNCQSTNYSSQYLNNQSPNYTNNYQSNLTHSNQNYLNNLSANSSTNSSLSSSTARKHNYQLKIKKSNSNNLQINEKNNDQQLKIENSTNNKTKLNTIENDEGIKIMNSDKDDGYEDDDFETKSCDNKSNDDDYNKDIELIKEQSSIDKMNLKDECDLKLDNQQNRSSEEMNKKNKQLFEELNENYILEHDKNDELNENNLNKQSKCIKILDENLNEIIVDEKLSPSSKIIESYLEEVEDRLEDYFKDLNVIELNNNKINQNELSIQNNELNSIKKQDNNLDSNQDNNQYNNQYKNQNNNISPNKQSKKKQDQNKIITFNLSYAKLTSNYVKLKWLVLNNGNNLYSCTKENPFMVEMIYSKDDKLNNDDLNNKSSRIVYQGLVKHCKIQGLKPLTEYSFRIKYIIDDQQLVSNLLTITTPETKPLINSTKKRSSKHNLSQLNLQQQQLLKQQILIEQKQKELQLQQQQHNQIVNKKSRDYSLIVIICAICTLFKDNFAYLLIIFFFISAIFSANYLSDVLN